MIYRNIPTAKAFVQEVYILISLYDQKKNVLIYVEVMCTTVFVSFISKNPWLQDYGQSLIP